MALRKIEKEEVALQQVYEYWLESKKIHAKTIRPYTQNVYRFENPWYDYDTTSAWGMQNKEYVVT